MEPNQPPDIPEPDENHEDVFPPEIDQDRELNLGESESEEVDEIINDANDVDPDDNNDASQSFSIYNRPRRGNAVYNRDGFMAGKFIILESKPANPDERDRIYECCLCQVNSYSCITFSFIYTVLG